MHSRLNWASRTWTSNTIRSKLQLNSRIYFRSFCICHHLKSKDTDGRNSSDLLNDFYLYFKLISTFKPRAWSFVRKLQRCYKSMVWEKNENNECSECWALLVLRGRNKRNYSENRRSWVLVHLQFRIYIKQTGRKERERFTSCWCPRHFWPSWESCVEEEDIIIIMVNTDTVTCSDKMVDCSFNELRPTCLMNWAALKSSLQP